MNQLKSLVKSGSLAVTLNSVKRQRRRGIRPSIAVFAPPSPHKNRGDEALLRAFLTGLQQRGISAEIFATGAGSLEFLDDFAEFPRHSDTYPAFTTANAHFELLQAVQKFGTASQVVLVGADVVDEGYGTSRSHASLRVLEQCAALGIPARVISFSLNETPSEQLADRFRRLGSNCRFYVRDPVSSARLASVPGLQVCDVGDLAYLLPPAPEESIPHEVRQFAAGAKGGLVGVNLIGKVLGTGDRLRTRFELFSRAVLRLAEQDGLRFLLIPHDDHEDIRDMEMLWSTMESAGAAKWSHLVRPVPRAPVAKAIVGLCVHLFTCRLHLGIAALGMGRPITGFPYQGKFEGQFDLFGLSHDGLVSPEQFPEGVGALVAMMRQRIAESDRLAAQIQSRLPGVLELSERNFNGLDPAGR